MKLQLLLSLSLAASLLHAQIGVNIGLPERGGTYIDLARENYRWNNLNIYVESSNEVWNTAPGFEQSQYNKAQATTR